MNPRRLADVVNPSQMTYGTVGGHRLSSLSDCPITSSRLSADKIFASGIGTNKLLNQ
jgi:hypothetical protein